MLFMPIACTDVEIPQILVTSTSLQAGKIYELEFLEEMDDLTFPSVLDSQELLLKSPLNYFAKKALIIKADDLKSDITARWQRYFNLIIKYGIRSTAGVITKYFAIISSNNIEYHQALLAGGFEYWHHGWDHQLAADVSEFKGTSYDHQYTHLRDGIDLIQSKLDYTIHSFGAPGNAWDATTAAALAKIPEIKVWLYGQDLPGKMNIPVSYIVEAWSEIFTLDEIKTKFAAVYDRPVVMFQIHPNAWDDKDFERFEAAMDYLVALDDWVFMTPYEYFKLAADRDNISVEKLDRLTYRIDLTAAGYDHDIHLEAHFTIQEL